MVKLFVFSLLTLLLALLITVLYGLPDDPGYLLIALGNYTFETSLLALLVAVVVVTICVKALLLFLQWFNPFLLIRYGRDYRNRRKARARSKTLDGLLYFVRGNWGASYKLLSRSSKDADATVINYLATAYAAHEIGDKAAWTQALEQAEKEYPSARSTVNYLRASLLFKSGQLEQCLAVLEQLRKTAVNDASLLQMLREVYTKLEDWEKLAELLPALEKNKLIDGEDLDRIQKRIFLESLYALVAKRNDNEDPEQILAVLNKRWKAVSPGIKADQKVVNHYIDIVLGLGATTVAGKVIEAALVRGWSDELVRRYGEEDLGNYSQQLLVAEGWLKERPANSVLLLALGRICMRNQLWGKARSYFEASLKISAAPEVYGELSRLLFALGENEAAETYAQRYRDFLNKKLPILPLPEK